MPSRAVTDAVFAHLASFTTCPVLAINEDLELPPAGGACVQVQFPFAIETQRSIGAPQDNWFREEGAIRFVIVARLGGGMDAITAIADELRTLFRNRRFSGVRTHEAQPVTLDDTDDRGGFFTASIAVAYEYDITA